MNIAYCLECGKTLTRQDETKYTCQGGHVFWNNPRATVAVVLRKDNKVLVSKRAFEPAKGKYDLPGGFLESGENPFDAAIRELREEAQVGLAKPQLKMLTAYAVEYMQNVPVCDIIILAESWEGEPSPADDSEALEWKPYSFLDSPDFHPAYKGLSQLLETV